LEALNENYGKGFRFFEIDFSWTSDGKLVAIHDWQGALSGMYIVSEGMGIPTEAEFVNLKMKAGLTQLSLVRSQIDLIKTGRLFSQCVER
jgi:glycerophosphoryl diester phosphodiesterase